MFNVRGEIGNYQIILYDKLEKQKHYPVQRAKELYRTRGYRYHILFDLVTDISYRKVCKWYNHMVRQPDSRGLKPSSLRYETKKEARQLNLAIRKKLSDCKVIEQSNRVSKEQLKNQVSKPKTLELIQASFKQVCEQAPLHLRKDLEFCPSEYEDKSTAIYIGIDDVCTKQQKSTRSKQEEQTLDREKSREGGKKKYKRSKHLFHTITKIVGQLGEYTLVAPRISEVWPLLMAFLHHNNLQFFKLIFIVDGQRVLHDYIENHLKCPFDMILDWYHLRKKIHRQLQMGLNKNDQRDEILLRIEQFAWHGLTQKAIAQLNNISTELVKDSTQIAILIGYFERNQKIIPNYAMRKQLELVCSSNRVEKENDFIVSTRQKNNGMSWTRPGSGALAQITATQRNREISHYLDTGEIKFLLAA